MDETLSNSLLIRDPAAELLVGRRIVDFVHLCVVPDQDRACLLSRLGELQKAIYALDVIGENHWDIPPAMLSNAWKQIREKACLIDSSQVDSGLRGILRYQEMELGIRKGVPVSSIPIGEFYEAKSCDVRMMRRIVGGCVSNVPERAYNEIIAAWQTHDEVTEIMDDLLDLSEDSKTMNGNRLLCLAKRIGAGPALKAYHEYLQRFHARIRQHGGMPLAESGCLAAKNALGAAMHLVSTTECQLELIVRRARAADRAA